MTKNFLTSRTVQGLLVALLGQLWSRLGWGITDAETLQIVTWTVSGVGFAVALWGRIRTRGESLTLGRGRALLGLALAAALVPCVCACTITGSSVTLPANCLADNGTACDDSIVLRVIGQSKLGVVRDGIISATDVLITAATLTDAVDVTTTDVTAVVTSIKELCSTGGTYEQLTTVVASHVTSTQISTVLTSVGALPIWTQLKAASGSVLLCDRTLIVIQCNLMLQHYGEDVDTYDGVPTATAWLLRWMARYA